ncbi:MAG: M1 family aminopeptidase [Candidatus Acidiferrales bacterium]
MRLFWEFFTFELKFRAKSISTYAYFLLWFLFSFFSVASESFGPVGYNNGKVLLNGPYAMGITYSFSSFFGMIVMAAIFGTSILRDFQRDTYQMIFTKPISKFGYLGGRWAGSFVTTVFAFSGLVFGSWLGTFAPWADHVRIGPNHFWWYVQPFLSITVTQIFFLGSLFFLVAALSRKIFVVYIQGVALFMLYLIGLTVYESTRSLERFWSSIFDPVGILMFQGITRYWTVAEKNTLLLSWSPHIARGVFLYNRLLWLSVGALALIAVWVLFPMSVEALTAKSQGRRAAKAKLEDEIEARPKRSLVAAKLPLVHPVFGPATTWMQYLSLTRMRTTMILREIPFWALAALAVVFSISNGYYAGRLGEQNVWPVTFLMVQAVEGTSEFFFYIVAALYAAELIWRERDVHVDGICDALPMRETVDWLSKFSAILVVEAILLAVTMVCGVLMQSLAGYYRFEFLQYFKELYLVTFPQIVVFALLAMFVQTVVSNKFIGHAIVIGIFVIEPILYNFGWQNSLYLFGTVPAYTYSDMNGYGHFVPALFWANLYWLAIAAVLGVLSIALTRRGSDDGWTSRWRLARARFPRLLPALAVFLLAAIGSGVWFYYNAHVLNEYLNAKARRVNQANYERSYKKYENLPQPKVIAIDTRVDIDPAHRSFTGSGTYTLQNKTTAPISEIHITDQNQSVTDVAFDRGFHRVSCGARDSYCIYALDQPLEPAALLQMTFKVGHQTRGFKDGNELAQFAYNGTFFDSDYFPYIGYNRGGELDDPRRRREEKLGPLEEMAPRGDPQQSLYNLFVQDSDWVHFHTIVSTSPDQIAIAPGYLKREWSENGRRYFEYDMGSQQAADFFAYISGRYSVRRENYKGVNIEVYYTPAHEFDVADMIDASKRGLDYYQQNFSPYQFNQYRIIEFPRYRQFAQSFPNTVPYSEDIGFIERLEKKKDIDFTYFVTDHELGHQWWGHQLIGGNVEGSNMMSETLAEYSALMVMEKKYGKDQMHRFLRHEVDAYLRGRSGETRREPPLVLVQREPYVWYYKGGLVMYTLADYIGEDKVNLALHNFLNQYRYANAGNSESLPYPDTRELVAALREQTPPELQYLITDGFESIVLYDNKAISAVVTPTADNKYKVTLTVQARKVKADGNGNESPMDLNDYIDVGVFSGSKDDEKQLYLKKEKFTQEKQTFEIVVDEMPTHAGIDPYNKLIDRVSDDNTIDVTRQ